MLAFLIFYLVMLSVNYLTYDLRERGFYGITEGSPTAVYWSDQVLKISYAVHIAAAFLRLVLSIGIYRFTVTYLSRITEKMTGRICALLAILLLTPIVTVVTIVYFMPENPALVYPICVTSILSDFGFIYFTAYVSENMETAQRARELEMEQSYYMEQQKEEERVRCIYHDMKNHLLILQARLDDVNREKTGEADGERKQENSRETAQMIEHLQNQIEDYGDYIRTGNAFLDIIIRDKAREAKKKKIDFHTESDFSGGEFLDGLDVSAIFGNALDNAIEACGKVTEEERYITVKAGMKNDFLIIRIANSAAGEAGADNEGRTTKKGTFLHGFGLRNIRQAVEKYGGECRYRWENGEFVVSIIMNGK